MSNIYGIDKGRRELDQCALAASEWIAKIDKGLSDTDAEALANWMRADPGNEAELLETARMWDRMDSLARLSEIFPHTSNIAPTPAHGISHRFAIAASFFAVAVGILMVATLLKQEDQLPQNVKLALTAYETSIGSVSTVDLPDGSLITLNTESRVLVSFNEQQRSVQLEQGEIHIDVAHDPARPLSVIAAGRTVQAVGTSFSVRIDSSQRVEVLVDDGRVQVGVREPGTAGLQPVEMPGDINRETLFVAQSERVMLNDGDERVELLEPEDIEVHLSWRNGDLIFRGESLSDAVVEVGRYTRVDFIIEDEDLKKLRVAGLFKAGDVAGFLASLSTNFDIVYQHTDDEKILLSAAEHSRPNAPE